MSTVTICKIQLGMMAKMMLKMELMLPQLVVSLTAPQLVVQLDRDSLWEEKRQ